MFYHQLLFDNETISECTVESASLLSISLIWDHVTAGRKRLIILYYCSLSVRYYRLYLFSVYILMY